MLDMGFIDTVKALIGKMPKARSGKEMTSGNIRGMIIDEMRNLRMMIQLMNQNLHCDICIVIYNDNI